MAETLGSKLDLLYNDTEGANYVNSFRSFLAGMDALIQASVISSTTTTPPSSPNQGDAYIVPTGATGAWTGNTNQVAVWNTQGAAQWVFYHPKAGWIVYDEFGIVVGQPGFRIFDGTNWSDPNSFPQPINFSSGIQIEGSQTLIRTNGNGDTIATTGGTLVADRVLTANADGNILESAIAIDDVATQSSANTFTQTQALTEGLTSNALVTLESPTPATNTANQNAPSFVLTGNAWNGTASIVDEWVFESTLGTGAEPTSTLQIIHSGSTGATSVSIPSPLTADSLTATTFLHTKTTTPATSGANQDAPELQLTGSYWTGSAAANDNWNIEATLGTGSNPTSTLEIIHNGSSGAALVEVPNLALTAATVLSTASAGTITPPAAIYGYFAMNVNGTDVRVPFYAP